MSRAIISRLKTGFIDANFYFPDATKITRTKARFAHSGNIIYVAYDLLILGFLLLDCPPVDK